MQCIHLHFIFTAIISKEEIDMLPTWCGNVIFLNSINGEGKFSLKKFSQLSGAD